MLTSNIFTVIHPENVWYSSFKDFKPAASAISEGVNKLLQDTKDKYSVLVQVLNHHIIVGKPHTSVKLHSNIRGYSNTSATFI